MCWSGEASTALAVAGLGSTVYFYRKGESKALCAALGYFSLMEALQAYTYTVIDDCSSPENQVATALAYVHIAFQPFFVNAVGLHFIPERIKKRISTAVYLLCLVFTTMFLLRLFPFDWAPYCYQKKYTILFCNSCPIRVPFCGPKLCSYSGDWHIAWAMPAKGILLFDNAYFIGVFVLPFLYGSWRLILYLSLAGPLLAYLTTNSANEWIAVWCLFSLALLLILMKTPLRRILYVKKWVWYR